jgi:hypothetical protein
VNGPDGKPYKTRQGGLARLSDLLAEAVAKATERITESGHGAVVERVTLHNEENGFCVLCVKARGQRDQIVG